MNDVNLFLAKDGKWVTNKSMIETLLSLKADKCDVLYIHTSLSFGQPNPQLKKSAMLDELLNVIKALGVKTICMPTFTFSFCNGLDYNPATSASRMGVLNEFFRKQEGVIRSADPLMSVALLGEDKDLVTGVGHVSCGENSTFDKLRHRDNVSPICIIWSGSTQLITDTTVFSEVMSLLATRLVLRNMPCLSDTKA